MTLGSCEDIYDRLVDYADGELDAAEASEVAEHVRGCMRCRETVEALERSLEAAGVIWADGAAEMGDFAPAKLGRTGRARYVRWAAVAAGVLLALGVGLVWRAIAPPSGSAEPGADELTFAEIEMAVHEAGTAAKLLAAADYIGRQPDGEKYAQERYTYLASAYPGTKAADQAKLRLKLISERSVLQ